MIHAEGLTKYYGDLCAVDQIHFDILKGEIVGLLGPNGAGKTTTLRMLTGFLRPSAGNIRVKELDIEEDTLEIKKILGYLPESAPLYHDMLVFDYLNYVADIRGLTKGKKEERIRKLADLCGINEVMHKGIGECSKGYKQRVGLAHAMMDDPEILVLDEPTSGLDPNQIIEIRDIIKRIGREKTVILSTHILSEAEATCDRVVIINQGRIVADGKLESIKKSAGHETVIHVCLKNAGFEEVETELRSIEGVIGISWQNAGRDADHINITCTTQEDIREDIYRKVKKTDWIMLELHQESRTLEHIFRELTKEN